MTKLCPRGKAAAKRKFKVYPSAYANAYASKVCAGKAKDDRGVRRKDFKGPKPSGGGGTGSAARKIRKANKGAMMNKPIKAGKGMLMPLFGLAGMAKYVSMNRKKSGTVAPNKGAVDPVTGQGANQTNTGNTNQKMMQAVQSMGKMGAKRGGLKVQKAGIGTMILANELFKQGKKKGRKQAQEGMMQDKQYQDYLALQDKPDTKNMSIGGMPQSTGSHIQQEIDGDSFTNPSAQEYYKDLLD